MTSSVVSDVSEKTPRSSRLTLKIGLGALAISLGVLGYTYYESKIKPLSGYGDDWAALDYLKDKDPKALSGGDLTHFFFGDISFITEAQNLPWQMQATFDDGDGVFERPFTPAVTSGYRADADGVGPLFNSTSCEGCHVEDGRAAPPTDFSAPADGLLFRVSIPGTDAHGGPKPHAIYGGQLADNAIPGHKPEVSINISYEEIIGQYADGSEYRLQKPIYSFPEQNYGPLGDDAMISPRIAPFMIGMGLIDAITDQSILEYADPEDKDGDGISGKVNNVWSVEFNKHMIGKYGWKAETPTLNHQSMDAAVNDMGVTNPLFPVETCTSTQTACKEALSGTTDAPVEMTEQQMNAVTTYLEFLGVPGRDYLDNPDVIRGEKLFKDTGCESCHRETFVTGTEQRQRRLHNQTIHPYSDFLLHDMGPDLADHRPSFDADGYEWRTPPLWGIGMVETVNGHTRFMHDGRARNLEEAILWHGGEAEQSKQDFTKLAQADREAIVKFLKSL
ncbi:di-heme oxidoredictase family protein [Neptuniibacter sp. SY11_33]|uniref:di-heme oxidoreductase family protein n=1 Tax=Neptuniibacter sp. SY11_33 TaxID=3398215 RepID=UPI0039F5A67A